jgi:hypothetical protein
MNKYLIERKKPIKAEPGWGTSSIVNPYQQKKNDFGFGTTQFTPVGNQYQKMNIDKSSLDLAPMQFGPKSILEQNAINMSNQQLQFGNTSTVGGSANDNKGNSENNKNPKEFGIGAAAISAGAQLADGAVQLAINKKEDSLGTDGFGMKKFNEGSVKSAGISGLSSGAAKGAAIAAPLLTAGPFGAIAGGAIIAGSAALGFFKGKKEGKQALTTYNKEFNNAMMGMGRQQDMLAAQSLYGKEGIKTTGYNLGSFSIPKSTQKTLVLRAGGKLETPGAVNIVVKGKLHKENNNLGNKDKGVPVVSADGVKEYEVEVGEIIFRQELTNIVEEYIKRYEDTKDEALPEELGKILVKEILKNTQDNSGEFGVKVSETKQPTIEPVKEKAPEVLVKKVDPIEKILAEKPEFNIRFVSDKALLDYDDPVEKRLLLKSIRKRYNELKDIFNNL